MKKCHVLVLYLAMVLCGCQSMQVENDPSAETCHYVTFTADAVQTKASMSYDEHSRGYDMIWEIGDRIAVFEYAAGFDYPVKHLSEPLQEGDMSDGGRKAEFRVSIPDAPGNDFRYVAVYPHISSGGYEPYCDNVDSRLMLRVVLPYEQSPSAVSFDASSNTMVSKVIESPSQITDIAELQFARIGSILKISLKDLEEYAGQQITMARFGFGDSFGGSLNCDYDTASETYSFYKGFNTFDLTPQSVVIDNDGRADLWIRCYAGEITDWFSIYLTVGEGVKGKGDGVVLGKYVDLEGLSRSIVIPEGKMTTFVAGSWGLADVQGVTDISYKVNSGMDGFTVTWNDVDHADGYSVHYWSDTDPEHRVKVESVHDNGNGTHSAAVTGLIPGTYNIKIIPVPSDGHALIDPEYYYPVSIPVGVETEKNVYNSLFVETLTDAVSCYDYEGLQMEYKNMRQSSWGSVIVTSKNEWGLWNINEFCNAIIGLTFIADASTATEYQPYTDKNSVDHMIRPMDYVKVLVSSGDGVWQKIEPEYGESYKEGGNDKYPVTYSFPIGTRYFKVFSDEEKLEAKVPAYHPDHPASLACCFYSIKLMVYE